MEEVNTSSVVQIRDRWMAWKNFNARTSKMGIVREAMNPQILEEKEGKIQLGELIDPMLMSISDNMRRRGMHLLNNAKNNMVDNF